MSWIRNSGGHQVARIAAAQSTFVDFTAASIQDPLSMGGVWTNNTQGTGGNAAMNTLASLRVELAVDGTTKIAQHRLAPVGVDYEDSFAFVPNVGSGNLRATATIYKDPSYVFSVDNHEIELLLGCKVNGNRNRDWAENLWAINGTFQLLRLTGPNEGFTDYGSNTGNIVGGPEDGDFWMAELIRSTNTVNQYVKRGGLGSWVLACTATNAAFAGLGNGVGIASYRQAGTTASNRLGFRNFLAEAF